MLPEEKLTELPVVGSNVLDLMKVMGGVNMTDSPTFGADRTTFGGVSAANVNLQLDGITSNDVRWATGASAPVFLNPETVGEFKLVVSPVDAEMGRGAGQVQLITRSGSNEIHGSGVWNIQEHCAGRQPMVSEPPGCSDELAESAGIHSQCRRSYHQEQDLLLCVVGSPDIEDSRAQREYPGPHALCPKRHFPLL